jgi:hypothetical protein
MGPVKLVKIKMITQFVKALIKTKKQNKNIQLVFQNFSNLSIVSNVRFEELLLK